MRGKSGTPLFALHYPLVRQWEGAGLARGVGGVAGARRGGLGRALGAPCVDLGQLASGSWTKKRKVTSNPEVPGPSRSWSPAPAAPSSPLDLRTRLYRRGYLRRKHRRARLSRAKAPWRCDRGAQANDLLPARAPRPCQRVTRLSVGAGPSRTGRSGGVPRAQARLVPGMLKAWPLNTCAGPTSRPATA